MLEFLKGILKNPLIYIALNVQIFVAATLAAALVVYGYPAEGLRVFINGSIFVFIKTWIFSEDDSNKRKDNNDKFWYK